MKGSKIPHHPEAFIARFLKCRLVVPLPSKLGRYKSNKRLSIPPRLCRGGGPRHSSWRGGGVSYFLILAFLLLPFAAHADPAADQRRAEALYTEVRCVQCQSESIADSDAQIAADMRALIREDIKRGLSDAQIRKTLSDHYGDYVLFRPRLSKSNLLLWFLPLLIIVLGGAALWISSKKTVKSNDYALSPDEQEKLDELMRPRD